MGLLSGSNGGMELLDDARLPAHGKGLSGSNGGMELLDDAQLPAPGKGWHTWPGYTTVVLELLDDARLAAVLVGHCVCRGSGCETAG